MQVIQSCAELQNEHNSMAVPRHCHSRLHLMLCALAAQVQDNSLGSVAAEQLLHELRPGHWFSAHLHTKFAALVPHGGGRATRFLALDKCLPGRNFLQARPCASAAISCVTR